MANHARCSLIGLTRNLPPSLTSPHTGLHSGSLQPYYMCTHTCSNHCLPLWLSACLGAWGALLSAEGVPSSHEEQEGASHKDYSRSCSCCTDRIPTAGSNCCRAADSTAAGNCCYNCDSGCGSCLICCCKVN